MASGELPFEPFPFLFNPHYQTIISSLTVFLSEPLSSPKTLSFQDGDKIVIEITTPANWTPDKPTVLLAHGVCGSHRSSYLVRLCNRLCEKGIRCARMNLRGCGSGKGLAKYMYHAGRSDDLFEVIKTLKLEHPDSPLVLVGFSLSGNITLKLLGELNTIARNYLEGAIAINPPIDLYSCMKQISEQENGFYERYFYRMLRADVLYRHKKFKDLPPVNLPKDLRLYEFDQLYIAPMYGFKSGLDYYEKCSSIQFIPEIDLKCKILLSEDDPIICHETLDTHPLPPQVDLYKTKKGGHLGYLGDPRSEKGLYWLDSVILDWISEMFIR